MCQWHWYFLLLLRGWPRIAHENVCKKKVFIRKLTDSTPTEGHQHLSSFTQGNFKCKMESQPGRIQGRCCQLPPRPTQDKASCLLMPEFPFQWKRLSSLTHLSLRCCMHRTLGGASLRVAHHFTITTQAWGVFMGQQQLWLRLHLILYQMWSHTWFHSTSTTDSEVYMVTVILSLRWVLSLLPQ